MSRTPEIVSDGQAMIAGMQPVLDVETFVFCTTDDPSLASAAFALSVVTCREEEGMTLVLGLDDAARLGFDVALPMARITLTVHSALSGVGLTAAVASSLAAQNIPCNMIAGYHHDHVFVPDALREQALSVLLDLQRAAAA